MMKVPSGPSYGGFKMDEAASILYSLIGPDGKDDYKQFASNVFKQHDLGNATKATVVKTLRASLKGMESGAKDFMLDAAEQDHPTPGIDQRKRIAEMLTIMLKNATTAVPDSR